MNLNQVFQQLSGIGFRVSFQGKALKEFDIEQALVEALYFIDQEGRLLSLILSWLTHHGAYLNVDKFFREYEKGIKYRGETPWFSGICAFMLYKRDHRFKKGVTKISPVHHIGGRNQNSLIKMKGAVSYFKDIGLLVAESSLRIREEDILGPAELISQNRQYRNRHLFGANWRADIITVIQEGAENANQVAKKLGLQRSRVGIVFKEYLLVESFLKN